MRRIELGSVLSEGTIAHRLNGFTLTNHPYTTPRHFGEAALTPAVPAGWDYEVYQGEHELASHNRRLGRFVLSDLTRATRGRTKVEVSFTMDADGILEVTAVEVGTGRASAVTIEASSGLTQDEIRELA